MRALFPLVALSAAPAPLPPDPVCADGALDHVSVWEWPRLMRERPHCATHSTRVLLRLGRGAMPVFGLGTGGPDDEPGVIAQAVRAGYRLVDTAELYANEHLVARGLALSGVHREGVFLVSKTGQWCPGWYPTSRGTLARGVCLDGFEETVAAVRASLVRLEVAYLDLFLLHWPMGRGGRQQPLAHELLSAVPAEQHMTLDLADGAHATARVEAWRALLHLRGQGVLRAVGVCNFSERQLEQLRAATGELPDVLQLEMHPLLQRPQLLAYCERHGILVQAYGNFHEAVTSHPAIRGLAALAPKLGKLVPEPTGIISMRWALQSGAAILPRSRKPTYIAANLQVFWPGFRELLTPERMKELSALDANTSLYGAHHLFVEDRVA